ncbi:YheT family hydrolase [Ferrovum myxofaciens]
MMHLSPAQFFPSPFSPSFWLRNPHVQTVCGARWVSVPRPLWRQEIWASPDGDTLQIERLSGAPDQPVLTLFHGLEGSAESTYIRALANAAQALGWSVVAPNFRACGSLLNIRPRLYHAGDSPEIHWILQRIHTEYPHTPRYAAGFSLGGNMLLKWLGEQGDRASPWVHRCVAVATPFDLTSVGDHLTRGLNRFYGRHFLTTLKAKARAKHAQFPGSFDLEATLAARTLRQFDDHCMAPLHGFRDASDYWKRSSCLPLLPHIRCPTLLLQARDDPFMPPHALPSRHALPPDVTLDFQARGGHVGFISGILPPRADWMPAHLLNYLRPFLPPSQNGHNPSE